MAEEKETIVDVKRSQQTRGMVAVLLITSVLVMVLTPLLTIYVFKLMARRAEPIKEVVVHAAEIALPKLQVNVADTQGTRYAQFEIVLEVSDSSMTPFFEEQSTANPKGRQRRIMASVISLVSDKSLNALLSSDGRRQLAAEVKARVNDLLAKETSGVVTDVYFSGFLIQ